MTDTPFSFTWNPSTWDGGDIAYQPPGGARFIARSMKVVNTDAQRDAWLWVGDLSTDIWQDQRINGLYCPAGSTQIIELDICGSGSAGSGLSFRQVADQVYSDVAVASAVAAFTSGTDAASYTTASWSSGTVSGTEYFIMTIAATGGPTTPTGFTDAHPQAWTLRQQANVYGSAMTMYQYTTRIAGGSTATTTVNFSGAIGACFISIVRISNVQPSGPVIADAQITAPAGIREYVPGISTQFVGMEARQVCGSRLLAVMAQTADGTGWTPWGDYREIHDAEIVGEGEKFSVSYAKSAGKSGYAFQGTPPTGVSNSNDHVAMMMDIHDSYAPVWVTVDGVEVT